MSMETCGDDRFKLIEEAKKRLIDGTNIEDRPEEMAVIDNVLFRFWQMGWLNQLREDGGAGTCHDLAETPTYRDKTEFKCSECGYEYSAVGGFGCDCGDEPDFNYCPNCGAKVVSE